MARTGEYEQDGWKPRLDEILAEADRRTQQVCEWLEEELARHGFRPKVRAESSLRISKSTFEEATYVTLRVPTDGLKELSNRQRQVAELLGRGCSRKEVATQLGMKTRTVDSHRERVCRKLKVSSRAALWERMVLLS